MYSKEFTHNLHFKDWLEHFINIYVSSLKIIE